MWARSMPLAHALQDGTERLGGTDLVANSFEKCLDRLFIYAIHDKHDPCPAIFARPAT